MNEKDYSPLPTACFRFLTDKMYDKRKQASTEIEKLVRNFNQHGKTNEIRKLLKILGQDLISNANPNYRKGGAIGLAAMAVGLGKDSSNFSVEIVLPIVSSLSDQDSRVRYYACEALYNVVKVIRGDILPLFNKLFDILCDLTADPDQSIRTGAELLDRLLKDIVAETPSFDVASFIPMLRERLYNQKPLTQRFVVNWVQLLNDIPSFDMLPFLHELLDGLFFILSRNIPELRQLTETVLSDFKGKLMSDPTKVDSAKMVNILVHHSQAQDPLAQLIALTWLKEFVNLISMETNETNPLAFCSSLLTAILPCLEARSPTDHAPCFPGDGDISKSSQLNVTEVARALNHSLMQLVTRESQRDKNEEIDLSSIFKVLDRELRLKENSPSTKMAVLKWIYHLHCHVPERLQPGLQQFFPVLLETLMDPSEEVVVRDLEVISRLTSCPSSPTNRESFDKFVSSIIIMFSYDASLLETRGQFIIRQLCHHMSSDNIYCTLAQRLVQHDNLSFINTMVQMLNRILFSAKELFDLRNKLREFRTSAEIRKLFKILYYTWSHNPVATVTLCLLTQNYAHASDLVTSFEQLDITLDFLNDLDQLVQLIESPIFAFLRLHLLDPENNQDLLRCLYGILMLIPQGTSFKLLSKRLKCVPSVTLTKSSGKSHKNEFKEVNFEELLTHFKETQERHETFQRKLLDEKFDSTR